jgi:hypothetical protein
MLENETDLQKEIRETRYEQHKPTILSLISKYCGFQNSEWIETCGEGFGNIISCKINLCLVFRRKIKKSN